MSRFSALGDMLGSVLERGARLVDWSGDGPDGELAALEALADALMTSKGEASGIALASEILGRYARLEPAEKLEVFRYLIRAFDPEPDGLRGAAEAWLAEPTPITLSALASAAEPRRQELFRRLNMAPGGTQAIVGLRADLLAALRENPELAPIDLDLRHLLASWFNRGFLVLRPIDWQTPAAILEKIIAYEAVHEIDSWDELRRRVDPPDRRCFAYFHPAIPGEPLIFVEVALTREVPGSIQGVLAQGRKPVEPKAARTAVFYSISNCQAGLAGVSFGAFLIKQVAEELAREVPGIETFVTLSPVPGLMRWLNAEASATPEGEAAAVLAVLDRSGWHLDKAASEALKPRLLALAARYFLEAKRPDGQPPDPVARFHLGNGAELMAVHWLGDVSEKGLAQSGGIMVNYHYRLDRIEANHEAYAEAGTIAAARPVRALLKS